MNDRFRPYWIYRLYARTSLTTKIVLVTVIFGISIWASADYFASKNVRNTFKEQLRETLNLKTIDYRYQFGRYVYAHRQAVKLLVAQKNLIEYILAEKWSSQDSIQLRFHDLPPTWFASHSVLRSFVAPRYALLLDSEGRAREAYRSSREPMPDFLLYPSARLLTQSNNQSFLYNHSNNRYVISSKQVLAGSNDQLIGTLLLVSPIDEAFMINAQKASTLGILVALVEEHSRQVIASSDSNLLKIGSSLESLKKNYLFADQEFYEYGSGEMDFILVTFVSTEEIEPSIRQVINKDRLRRALLASLLVVAFTLIIVWITRRISLLTHRIEDFSHQTLGSDLSPETESGDQLDILEDRFQLLTEEVIESHKAIRREADITAHRQSEMERGERQLNLLHSITESLAIGVMTGQEGRYESFNEQMKTFEEKFGNLSLFALAEDQSEERLIQDKDGKDFIFHLLSPDILPDSKVTLARDITEQKESAAKIQYGLDLQRVINAILQLGLEQIPFQEQLDQALDIILSLPWLHLHPKGAVFLISHNAGELVMKSQRGFTEEHRDTCGTIPIGKCVCGKAAASQKIEFMNCNNDLHEFDIPGSLPHGHYCVPILSGNNLLGVLTLYLDPNHERKIDEEESLSAIARTLAGLIELHRVDKDNKILQSQLTQAMKMESIGTLAGGIAHDFNNILSIVIGYAELIRDDSPKGSFVRENISEVQIAAGRAKDLVKQILAFSRQAEHKLIPVKLQNIVKETIKLLRSTIPATIEIVSDIHPLCGVVAADPIQINQIIMNLCTNAVHAMDEKGVLGVTLQEINLDAAALKHRPDMVAGPYVELSVSDTGTGISPELIGHVFDPFFTTKEVGGGTGMGLSVVHGIVMAHHGMIEVETKLGKGTTFRVYFPIANAEEEHIAESVASLPRGTERILLVDDEESITDFERIILERQGYHVTTKQGSLEALETFKAGSKEFDLVITDQSMPKMSGVELSAEILKIRPDMPIILCTGYSAKISEEDSRAMGIREFLLKPVMREKLVTVVRKVLDEKVGEPTEMQ